jgi:hypothetical protein
MIEMLENEIIPHLIELHVPGEKQAEEMSKDPDYPLFTLVFDREGYSPSFFKRIWDKHRIAVLTYRKNVKDSWDEAVFEDVKVETRIAETEMKLHEEAVVVDQYPMREVRRLCPNSHQTSIVTNNKILPLALIAAYMFGRWIQENFFRYLRQEYSFDKIIQYTVDDIDNNIVVVNREYSNIEYKIKKSREKLSRLKAKFYDRQQESLTEEKADENSRKKGKWFTRQLELQEEIEQLGTDINKLIEERKNTPYKIPLGKMPVQCRYSKLNQESKYLMNIVKMICYRAETALAHLIAPHYKRDDDEVRMLVKAITLLSIDLMPDYDNNKLNIYLYPPSNNRSREAIANIIDTVNKTNTVFPGTNLTLFFNIATF